MNEIASKIATLVIEKLEGKALLRPRWLNYEQAAAYLGFVTAEGKPSVSALRQRKDQFPEDCHQTIGKAVRWDVEALDSWLVSKKPKRRRK